LARDDGDPDTLWQAKVLATEKGATVYARLMAGIAYALIIRSYCQQ